MAAVQLACASIDERGKISGGKAGNQTGRELRIRNYYVHSKGWRVLRCIHPEMRPLIAAAMKAAVNNRNIGYDQNQRNTLYRQVQNAGFDPAKATTPCETDCSALVRVAVLYALRSCGNGASIPDFYTANEASILLKTGLFTEMEGTRYTRRSDYLCAGDILVTRTKGHTEVVLNNGSRADTTAGTEHKYALGERLLKNGSEGADVKELQSLLIQLGYDCGKWGADGDFGDATEMAVEQFQRHWDLDADGEYGPKTHTMLMNAVAGDGDASAQVVEIVGGNCYIRSEPNTSGAKLGIAHAGDKLTYRGEISEDGWYGVEYNGTAAWVSGKYARIR